MPVSNSNMKWSTIIKKHYAPKQAMSLLTTLLVTAKLMESYRSLSLVGRGLKGMFPHDHLLPLHQHLVCSIGFKKFELEIW